MPSLPSSLLTSLRAIPQDTDLPSPPADLAVTADGQLVSVLRPERAAPLVQEPPAGTGGHPVGHHDAADGEHHVRRSHRRRRIGTGMAVSGLALGAIALAAPSAVAPEPPAPAATTGALGGSVLGGGPANPVTGPAPSVVDAQLRLSAPAGPGRTVPARTSALDPLDRMPGSFLGLRP
ncbi:hypothetical protein BJF78_29850 [Pseudonocardia sp. CNS-139]|nr:hypothetical protein BJF78_29850 [Pseudonocardia sp. CNS-139]